MKRALAIVVLLCAGLAVALYFRFQEMDRKALAPAGGSGVIEAVEVDVVARISARILKIHADEGQAVAKGSVLVDLDCAEPTAALEQARASLAAAEAAVEAARAGAEAAKKNTRAMRSTVLATQSQIEGVQVSLTTAKKDETRILSMNKAGAISDARVDKVTTQVASLRHQIDAMNASTQAAKARSSAARGQELVAQAQILAARAQVEVARAYIKRAEAVVVECRLIVPRSGHVLARNHEPGEAVLPGAKLMTLVDLSEVRATFFLPNAELASAKAGGQVQVRADAYPGEHFPGHIRHVSAKAEFTPRNVQTREDRDRLVYAVEVEIPNPDGRLRAGMPVEVAIEGSGGVKTGQEKP